MAATDVLNEAAVERRGWGDYGEGIRAVTPKGRNHRSVSGAQRRKRTNV
jgi:hypothetical protein